MSTCSTFVSTHAIPPQISISPMIDAIICGRVLNASLKIGRVKRSPTLQPISVYAIASSHSGTCNVMVPVECSAAPTTAGSNNAPEGIRNNGPSQTPASANNKVAAKRQSTGGNQITAAAADALSPRLMRATNAAAVATNSTRRYCMKATSRTSAPKSPAMATIALAPPGEEPHAPVGPGKLLNLTSSQPDNPLASRVAISTSNTIGQSLSKGGRIEGDRLWAIIQPKIPCAILKKIGAIRTVAPSNPIMTPTIIGPSSKAAGT